MKYLPQKLFLCCALMLSAACVMGQAKWKSPEVAQMFRSAHEYMQIGNYREAIRIYRQAIVLEPGDAILSLELGRAQYLAGDFSDAEATLTAAVGKAGSTDVCYQLLALSQEEQHNEKKAKKTIEEGLERFPASGLLYNERGKLFYSSKKRDDALNAWLDGTLKAPVYAPNYMNLSIVYLESNSVIWGLLYGEMYLCLTHDTTGDAVLKSKIFAGYKKMFDGIGSAAGLPDKNDVQAKFIDAVQKVYLQLTPVVSDGITAENLTMVRTRFLMDWYSKYAAEYPFSLFAYYFEMIRTGHFEIYNEVLFGKAENDAQFIAWDKFHEGDIARFVGWAQAHPYRPLPSDIYNDQNFSRQFGKRSGK